MPDAIEIRGVSKTFFAGNRTVPALAGVDLSVRENEFLAIVGPAGCGKSTLLRLIGDLDTADTGTISVFGRPPPEARLARQYALVFQAPTLLEWRTVQANLELPLEILGVPAAGRAARAVESLRLFRLEAFARAFPSELSAGMQMQAAIGRALALRPRLLLMDEPFGALDELTRERLGYELLGLWGRAPVTILFVTHNLGEAVLLADRVVVMTPRPGRVARVIEIDLPRPRTNASRATPRFWELVEAAREGLDEFAEETR